MDRALLIPLLLCIVTFSACTVDEESGSGSGHGHELHILVMTSSSSGRFNSSGAEVAVRLAVDRINGNASLLSGYLLELTRIKDTTVSLLYLQESDKNNKKLLFNFRHNCDVGQLSKFVMLFTE